MCNSNCPNEINFHCDKRKQKTIESHCIDGFICKECEETFLCDSKESEIENICIDCFNENEENKMNDFIKQCKNN